MSGIIAGLVLFLDQLTKYLMQTHESWWNVEVIKNFFYITYAKNTGMAWSLLSGQQLLLSLIAAFAIGVMIWYLQTHKCDMWTKVGLSLMIGGAAGNLFDRLFLNYVRDFLNFYIFGYDFPIFNVADMALCIGVACMLIGSLADEKKGEAGNE